MPQVLSESFIAKFSQHLYDNGVVYDACRECGVTTNNYPRWRREAERNEKVSPELRTKYQQLTIDFRDATNEAIARREAYLISVIQDAATKADKPSWQAGAWLLERQRIFEGRYVRAPREIVSKNDAEGDNVRPPESSLRNLLEEQSDDELKKSSV